MPSSPSVDTAALSRCSRPVPERLVIEVAGTPAKPVEEVIPPDDSIPAWLEEDPLARAILVGGVANPQRRIDINAVAGTPRDIALAAGHLDRDHLIDKDLGGWKLTRAGVDVAQVIMRRGLDITEPARTSWGRIVD